MTTKVFLDLEDTVISSWDFPVPINIQPIRDWLDSIGKTPQVHIFSFAIWDASDKAKFLHDGMKKMLEQELNAEIVEWLSVTEMHDIVEEWSGFKFESRMEFMQFLGKHDAFIKLCLAREQRSRCVLIDDAIPNRTVCDHDRGLTIDLLPVHILTRQPRQFEVNNI
jgi:hypothetical protein